MAELRIGQVSAVDTGRRMVRVRFPDVEITSGWLKVLNTAPATGSGCTADYPSHTQEAEKHTHDINLISWFPKVGDMVLCVYNTGFNEDGFVIGGLS